MNHSIELNIEELVLHGFSHHDAYLIRQALERELSRLLSERGLPETFSREVSYPELPAGPLELEAHPRPESVGSQIANAVYQGFNR